MSLHASFSSDSFYNDIYYTGTVKGLKTRKSSDVQRYVDRGRMSTVLKKQTFVWSNRSRHLCGQIVQYRHVVKSFQSFMWSNRPRTFVRANRSSHLCVSNPSRPSRDQNVPVLYVVKSSQTIGVFIWSQSFVWSNCPVRRVVVFACVQCKPQ